MAKNTYSDVLQTIAGSERKREIARLIARGYTIPEIAQELGIGDRTVKTHLEQLRLAFGGVPRREIPQAWYTLTGENLYPDDAELEVQ